MEVAKSTSILPAIFTEDNSIRALREIPQIRPSVSSSESPV
jgi:hypothetical protein